MIVGENEKNIPSLPGWRSSGLRLSEHRTAQCAAQKSSPVVVHRSILATIFARFSRLTHLVAILDG
jgi:hypothetical protein